MSGDIEFLSRDPSRTRITARFQTRRVQPKR